MTTSPLTLRVIEPMKLHGFTLAEVFKSKIGLNGLVVLQMETEEGEPAEVSLTPTEANDLRLWLECALSLTHPTAP